MIARKYILNVMCEIFIYFSYLVCLHIIKVINVNFLYTLQNASTELEPENIISNTLKLYYDAF